MSFVSDLCSTVREPHFGRLYATRLAAQAADGTFSVALAGFVFFSPERRTTAVGVAAAFAVLLLPYSLVGPFAGVLLDRWRRQRVLVVGNLVRSLLVVGVAALVGSGVAGPAFYGAALATLSVNRFFLAALSAALPHVVRRDELVMANAVATTSGTVAAIVGGGLGYLVRQAVGEDDAGTAVVVAAAAVGYLGSAAIARRLGRDLLGPDADPDRPQARAALAAVARGLIDGAKHVWECRTAAHALGAISAHRFCYGVTTIATILLYRNTFAPPDNPDAGLAGLGLVFAASGAGVLTAAVVTPEVTPRLGKQPWIALCLTCAAVVTAALAPLFTEAAVVAAAYLLGAAAQSVKICVDTLLQEQIEDAYRGRVFSFYDVLFNVTFVAAAAAAALVLPASGRSYGVVAAVAGGYAVTAAAYWGVARRRSADGEVMAPIRA